MAGLVVDAVEAEFLTTSIPVSAWQVNPEAEKKAAGLEYMAAVTVEGATEKDGVNAVLPVVALNAASACGMANTATVVAGAVRFYAVTIPESALPVQIQIIKGK